MCRPAQKCSYSTVIACHGFIGAMTRQDSQDEVGATLAQIAMIAEEVNVLALDGSGASCTQAGQMAISAEVQRLVGVVSGLGVSVARADLGS